MWEHARRSRVGNPAGSAGGRLRVRFWAILDQMVCARAPVLGLHLLAVLPADFRHLEYLHTR